MRLVMVMFVAILLLWSAGCARGPEPDRFAPIDTSGWAQVHVAESDRKPKVISQETIVGTVVKVHGPGGFVILNFPPGQIPRPDALLDLYRRGVKMGEVRVTARQLDDYVVADLVMGQAEMGDQAKGR